MVARKVILLRKDHPSHLERDRELEEEEEMIVETLMNLMIVGWEMDRMKRIRMRQKLKQKEKFHKRNSLNHYVDKLSIEYVFQLNLWTHLPIKQGNLINQLGGEEEEILLLHLPLLVDGGHERRKRKIPKRPRWVYMVQGPPGPPGQGGRDGRGGASAPPVPAPHQIPSTTTNLDTSALEQSFDRVGQNIVNVLTEQCLTNERLEQQFNSNNESLQEQADAMRDLADTTAKRAYDHMFVAIPIFDGTKPELFNDWLESIETLCEESGRDIRTEVMGRAGPIVQRILKSIPANKRWSIQREELRRCVSDIPTKVHAARKLQTLRQEPKENLRAFIHRFTTLHYITNNRSPEQECDVTHIVQFLSAIRNSKISKRIAEQRIPEGMTLQELFMKALDFEAGLQMSEGVTQK